MPEPTYYAKLLAEELRKRGILLKMEYYDNHKSVDIFIPSAKLDIEIDGSHHNSSSQQAITDLKRTKYSLREGRITIRIPNSAIYQNISEVADNILEIIEDTKSKKKNEKIKELIKRKETTPIKEKKNVFRYSPKKKVIKKNKRFIVPILVIFLLIATVGMLINNNKAEGNKEFVEQMNTVSEINDFEISTTKTEIIIKNNLDKGYSLEITYRIYSNWFGVDSTKTELFEILPKKEEIFTVYSNDGCKTSPCSVEIIKYEKKD